MAVIRKRNKLVSFRVSEQEYEVLQNLILTQGWRSISDFARGTLCDVLENNIGQHQGNKNGVGADHNGRQTLGGANPQLEELIQEMRMLRESMDRNSQQLENHASALA